MSTPPAPSRHTFLLRQFSWYAIGFVIPNLLIFARSPIYTRIFSPTEYGHYTLSLLTATYIGIVLFSWTTSCVWRYYNTYKTNNQLPRLYSSLVALLTLAFSTLLLLLAGSYWLVADPVIYKLFAYSCCSILLNEVLQLFTVALRLEEHAPHYNQLVSMVGILGFCMLLALTFWLHWGIESFLLSNIFVTGIAVLLTGLRLYQKGWLSPHQVSWPVMRKMLAYGKASVFISLLQVMLVNSDRYLIQFFHSTQAVGIYNQVYNIAQLSVIGIHSVIFSLLLPVLNRQMSDTDNGTSRDQQALFNGYMYVMLPLVTWLAIFARLVAFLLLGNRFRTHYHLIPWIAFSVLLTSISAFPEQGLRFAGRSKSVVIGYAVAFAVNTTLNILLLPHFDFAICGFTTLISCAVLLAWNNQRYHQPLLRHYLRSRQCHTTVALLLIQYILHTIIANQLKEGSLFFLVEIAEGLAFAGSYLLLTRHMKPLTTISTLLQQTP